jgi:hypothetical protein
VSKLFGKYRGRVEDNADPRGLGRLQVSSPTALGDGVLSWAMPCVPYAEPGVGLLLLPPVGAEIWLEFEHGDPRLPVWAGFLWGSAVTPPPTSEAVHISTRGGHRLVLNDLEQEVSLIHSNGSVVKLEASGAIQVTANATVRISASAVDVEAGTVKAAGVVKCETLIANSVVASSYTTGAGN